MHHTLIAVVLGTVCGIIIGHNFRYGSEAAIASLFLFAIQLFLYFNSKKESSKGVSVISLVTLLFSFSFFIGVLRMQFVSTPKPFLCSSSCTFVGRVDTYPEIKEMYQVFDVEVEPKLLLIKVRAPLYPEYEVGDLLTISGRVAVPSVIFPHGDKKAFDYISYLHIKNIGSEIYYPKIERAFVRPTKTFEEKLLLLKKLLIEEINFYISSPASSLASGMLLGNTDMSKELTQSFRVAGLSHIVVLSGFNIAILISSLLFIFRIFPMVVRIIIVASFVILFVIMVGAEPSIVRATLMSFISLLALLLGRGYKAEQALMLSFLGIILYSPLSLLYDVSLHLSFLATAGIIYTSQEIKNFFSGSLHRVYSEIVATTLSAYFATLPYIMSTFGTVSLYAVASNFFVLPFVPLIMLLTFCTIVLATVSKAAANIFGYVTSLLGDLVIGVVRFVESLPFSTLSVQLSTSGVLGLYFLILLLYVFLKRRKKDETQLTNNNDLVSGVISY